MDIDCLPLEKTGYFSKLICDYIAADSNLRPLYNRFPDIESFKGQIEEKRKHFTEEHRNVLYNSMLINTKTQINLKVHLLILNF